MKNYQREFHWLNKAFYANNIDQPTITFGYAPIDPTGDNNNSISGEMEMRWELLTSSEFKHPKLHCWADGMFLLPHFSDVFDTLFQLYVTEDFTQEEFVEVLLACGFKDATRYKKD